MNKADMSLVILRGVEGDDIECGLISALGYS
jgi:hypothetical protein